jgi:hypothetical protein
MPKRNFTSDSYLGAFAFPFNLHWLTSGKQTAKGSDKTSVDGQTTSIRWKRTSTAAKGLHKFKTQDLTFEQVQQLRAMAETPLSYDFSAGEDVFPDNTKAHFPINSNINATPMGGDEGFADVDVLGEITTGNYGALNAYNVEFELIIE